MTTLLVVLAAGYALIVGLAYVFQDQLLYFPSEAIVATPDQYGFAYEDVHIDTEDGERLHAWWIPSSDVSRGTLLFFHGNAGNISGRLESVAQFHELGLNVLIVDYRGYGRSTGSPSEEGLYRDARASWRHLVDERGVEPRDMIIFGRSLGAAPAAWLAVQEDPGALIMESAFTSVPDVGAHHYPFLPVRQLARNEFDNEARVQEVDTPLLLIHSRDDQVIPFEHGQSLYEVAREPKEFLEIQGGHNDGFLVSEERYLRTIDRFLQEHFDREGERTE